MKGRDNHYSINRRILCLHRER